MDNKERIAILEKSFDLVEDCIVNFVVEGNEELTRHDIKTALEDMLSHTIDHIQRQAIAEAYRKIEAMSFNELLEMKDLLSDDDEIDDDNDDDASGD